MSILNNVDELAAKEREIRRLEKLITVISSLDDEELVKNWPRILAVRDALMGSSTHAPMLTEPCDYRALNRQFLPRKLFRLTYRCWAIFLKTRLVPKQRVSEIIPEWPAGR